MQQSLQQLQALGEQLKSQVDASSVAALQSDHRSLVHRLATLEHGLHRHQEILQVRPQRGTCLVGTGLILLCLSGFILL